MQLLPRLRLKSLTVFAENPLQKPVLVFIDSEAAILHGDLYALRKVSTVVPVSACKDYGMTIAEMVEDQRQREMLNGTCKSTNPFLSRGCG